MRISDWSSDVCSSDLLVEREDEGLAAAVHAIEDLGPDRDDRRDVDDSAGPARHEAGCRGVGQTRERGDIERDHLLHGVDAIGRASCRERVCQYVSIWVVAVSLKKNINTREHYQ